MLSSECISQGGKRNRHRIPLMKIKIMAKGEDRFLFTASFVEVQNFQFHSWNIIFIVQFKATEHIKVPSKAFNFIEDGLKLHLSGVMVNVAYVS